jgi:hypothetical protein
MEGTTPDHAHQPPQSRPVLFISHLTEDRQVADVLTHFVRAHSGGLVQVFQTSTDIAQSGRHQRQQTRESPGRGQAAAPLDVPARRASCDLFQAAGSMITVWPRRSSWAMSRRAWASLLRR